MSDRRRLKSSFRASPEMISIINEAAPGFKPLDAESPEPGVEVSAESDQAKRTGELLLRIEEETEAKAAALTTLEVLKTAKIETGNESLNAQIANSPQLYAFAEALKRDGQLHFLIKGYNKQAEIDSAHAQGVIDHGVTFTPPEFVAYGRFEAIMQSESPANAVLDSDAENQNGDTEPLSATDSESTTEPLSITAPLAITAPLGTARLSREVELSREKGDLRFGSDSINSEIHPGWNEDRRLELTEYATYAVFDGLGGSMNGELAATTAAAVVAEVVTAKSQEWEIKGRQPSLDDVTELVKAAIVEAHNRINELTEKPEFKNIATTASVVKIWQGPNGERKAIIGNVGDSRVYILRKNGNLEQVTIDDSKLTAKAGGDNPRARLLQKKFNNVTSYAELTPEEKALYDQKNIVISAVGGGVKDSSTNKFYTVVPRTYRVDINEGDLLLISSDGVHDSLTDRRIEALLRSGGTPRELVRKLTSEAYRVAHKWIQKRDGQSFPEDDPELFRAKPDDITAQVLKF